MCKSCYFYHRHSCYGNIACENENFYPIYVCGASNTVSSCYGNYCDYHANHPGGSCSECSFGYFMCVCDYNCDGEESEEEGEY